MCRFFYRRVYYNAKVGMHLILKQLFCNAMLYFLRDHSKDEKSKHSNSEQCGLDTNRSENGSQNGSDRSDSLLSTNEKDSLINKKKKVKRQSSHQMLNQFVSLVKQSESIEKIQPASVHD